MLELFCENVEMNYSTKTLEVIFQVNMTDGELIEKFNLLDAREPIVNIYVGINNDTTIKYINCDYHTCDGEHWYSLNHTFSDEDVQLLQKEAMRFIK